MREPDKTVWKIGEKWVGKGGGGADGLVGIAFDLFAMRHILRFRNIKWANVPISTVYNFTVLCLIKLFWLLFCKFVDNGRRSGGKYINVAISALLPMADIFTK